MRAKSDDTMALVIDYQEKLVPAMEASGEFIKNSRILINGLNVLNVPMVITQQYTKGLGVTIDDIRTAIPEGVTAYDKTTFSVTGTEEAYSEILRLNKKNIIVCGCEAHICVLQTVIDLKMLGYNVIVVSDCVASRKVNDKNIGLVRAEQEGALITTYEAILFELLGKAGSDEFKRISSLIK